jgi:precorrin-6B methylase 2
MKADVEDLDMLPASQRFAATGRSIAEAPSAELAPDRLLQLGLGFWGAKALLSAVELGLFTELARGGRTTAQLRESLGLHPRSAHDFLDALVALGALKREGEVYANTPEADFFLDRAKPSYVGGLLEMANARLYRSWGGLTTALRTGEPQSESGDSADMFAELYSDPQRLRQFLSAMTGVSMGVARALADAFPWTRYKSFVDVGAAQGCVPVQLALAHPHLAGGNFDLPAVGPIFEEYVSSFGLQDRLRFLPGNFFADPLPQVDVIIMGHILHDWSLEQKRELLAKAWRALPEGGALIVYDAIIDDDRRQNAFGLLMSLNMLIETPRGFDYTGSDCIRWMREAGFRETRVEHLCGPDSMVVGFK